MNKLLLRGDFWISIMILILLISMKIWDRLAIDVAIHDTYYVIEYTTFVIPNILFFTFIGVIYFLLGRKNKEFTPRITLFHLLFTLTSTLIYFWIFFGKTIALSGFERKYVSISHDVFEYNVYLLLANFAIFLVVQPLFIIVSILRLARK